MRRNYLLKDKEKHEQTARSIYHSLIQYLMGDTNNILNYEKELKDAFWSSLRPKIEEFNPSEIPDLPEKFSVDKNRYLDTNYFMVEGVPTRILLESRPFLSEDSKKIVENRISLTSFLGMKPYHKNPEEIPVPENFRDVLMIYSTYINEIIEKGCLYERISETIFIDEENPNGNFAEIKEVLIRVGDLGKLRKKFIKGLEKTLREGELGFWYNS